MKTLSNTAAAIAAKMTKTAARYLAEISNSRARVHFVSIGDYQYQITTATDAHGLHQWQQLTAAGPTETPRAACAEYIARALATRELLTNETDPEALAFVLANCGYYVIESLFNWKSAEWLAARLNCDRETAAETIREAHTVCDVWQVLPSKLFEIGTEYTAEAVRAILTAAGRKRARMYANIRGWDVFYTIIPGPTTPTGCAPGFPRTGYLYAVG